MKKDIKIPEVKNVHVAIVKEDGGHYVYLVNDKRDMIDMVMVTSKGYANATNGEKIETSTMRHMVGSVPAKTAVKIEAISDQVFKLNNEYWVTFFEGQQLQEKKFIFGSYTITKELEEHVPVMNVQGVVVW